MQSYLNYKQNIISFCKIILLLSYFKTISVRDRKIHANMKTKLCVVHAWLIDRCLTPTLLEVFQFQLYRDAKFYKNTIWLNCKQKQEWVPLSICHHAHLMNEEVNLNWLTMSFYLNYPRNVSCANIIKPVQLYLFNFRVTLFYLKFS